MWPSTPLLTQPHRQDGQLTGHGTSKCASNHKVTLAAEYNAKDRIAIRKICNGDAAPIELVLH